jgi:hypothetical protein
MMRIPATSTLFFITLLLATADGGTCGSTFTTANHPAPIQKSGTSRSPDLVQLRSRFTAAVGKDFEVVKDEFTGRANAKGGGTYWLVHVKPTHGGYFLLNYRYNYNHPHYSHVERDFPLGVGPAGCRRGPPHYGSYSKFCVGDTIIVPIIINNFTEHEFKLTSKAYTAEDEASFEKRYPGPAERNVNAAPVANPAADLMRYVGSTSHKMLHRNGGYTIESYAEFEAQRPGRLNLAVSVSFPGVAPSASFSAGVPIIIVARDQPVTLLASSQAVRGYTRGYDGREYEFSSSGESFMTDLMILQPGDRISLTYHSAVRSRQIERRELAGAGEAEPVTPLIGKLPFALRMENDFTEWLADYLPQ